ncbi:MAG: YheC/YheD family protein [Defluviitaleaceae bacterium]|nr:YheC/YheD family protein [Defluviitaleaceae bacterium]
MTVGYLWPPLYKKRTDFHRVMSGVAAMRGIELFHFFSTKSINFDDKTILGNVWSVRLGRFVRKPMPFPDIIQDVTVPIDSKARDRLRRAGVLTTWVNLGGKIKIDNILTNSQLEKYTLKTYSLQKTSIEQLLDEHETVIAKPLQGMLGGGVHKFTKSNYGIFMHLRNERRAITSQQLHEKEEELRAKNYIAQEFFDSRTKAGNPFDVKIYTIRGGGNGEWTHLTMLPRVGAAEGLVSNVGQAGNALLFPENFLRTELGDVWEGVYDELKKLAKDVPVVLEKEYKRPLTTIGIDVGIERKNNTVKLFEANSTIYMTPHKMEMFEAHINQWKWLYNHHKRMES